MAYFSENFMNERRNQWLRSIHSVQVLVDNTWHTGDITRKDVEDDTLVIMATFPSLDDRECTITASRIVDVRGMQASYQQRIIKKNVGQGVLIKITVPIYEV